jgi:hypothetical protein
MSFKLLYTNLAGPQGDFLVDPAITFEAGQLGTITGNSAGLPVVELALSGNAVLGIIDDNKATQFLATVVAEAVAVGQTTLNNANIVQNTFAPATSGGSTNLGLTLGSATNGTIVATTGGTVSYSYYIPGKAGDDSTLASGKCTLWLQPGEYATDVYEVTAISGSTPYAYGVSTALTTSANSKIMEKGSAGTLLGYVTKTPSAGNPFLHFYKV